MNCLPHPTHTHRTPPPLPIMCNTSEFWLDFWNYSFVVRGHFDDIFSQACSSTISTPLQVQCTLLAPVMNRVLVLILHRTWWLPRCVASLETVSYILAIHTETWLRHPNLWKPSLTYLQSTQQHDYVILMTVKISYFPRHKTHLFPPPVKSAPKITLNINTTKIPA